MKVFVTGATGFVGYHTVLALTRAGHDVRLGVRNAAKMQALYEGTGVDVSDFAVGQITDKVSIDQALQGCDAVVHTAAMVSLDPSDEEHMRHTSLAGTQCVIGGAVEQGIESIVYVSSVAALFDPARDVLNEETPLAQPESAYGKSKRECDAWVRGLQAEGARIAVTYPSGIIGPDDPGMSEGNQALAYFFNVSFMHTTTGLQLIDVRDLADIHVRLLEQSKCGPYLTTSTYTPYKPLGKLLDSVISRPLRKLPAPKLLLQLTGAVVDFFDRHIMHLNTPITGEAVRFATQWVYADDSKVRGELDIAYRPLVDTLRDTVRWLAREGHIKSGWVD